MTDDTLRAALKRLTPILDAADASVVAGTLPVDVLNITQPVRNELAALSGKQP